MSIYISGQNGITLDVYNRVVYDGETIEFAHDTFTRIRNSDPARDQNIYGYTFNRKYPETIKE